MKTKQSIEAPQGAKAAFLWDESFLWALMSFHALSSQDLACDLVSAEEIRSGRLSDYSLLFVPGGWASNKVKALGDDGVAAIRSFVEAGGSYLGFCGGAGLATQDGIGLLNISRRPSAERVPSFSGPIRLQTKPHALWGNSAQGSHAAFHAWWPSQFVAEESGLDIIARYGEALPGSFSSDLNVGDVPDSDWAGLEALYGINLDPRRLKGEPAVVEGQCGKGKVLLSLIHFDTPEDAAGAAVLRNAWEYLGGGLSSSSIGECRSHLNSESCKDERGFDEITARVEELIALGIRNFLWFQRTPMLLQWRRGVRGLEYCTLSVMTKEIRRLIRTAQSENFPWTAERLTELRALVSSFSGMAKKLLVMERLAMQRDHITYEKCTDPEMKALRAELFGNSKSHGGLFKKIVGELDAVLFLLLRAS